MSAKYYKRGQREFFMIRPGMAVKIINKEWVSYLTISHDQDDALNSFLIGDYEGATEITREEFAKEFEVASRLIVLEP